MKLKDKITYWASGVLLAQGEGVNSDLFRDIRGLFPNRGLSGSQNIGDAILSVLQILLMVAGGIAVIYVVVGAYKYILARGNEESSASAKKTMTSAIWGIIIIILAFAIVSIVGNLVTGDIGVGGNEFE